MCGRFTLTVDKDFIASRFLVDNLTEFEWNISYNIAPSQMVLAIVNDHTKNRAGYLKWGLVPSWASDPSIGYKMINARAETLDQKPSFKKLLSRRRCLIVADSFYEWKKDAGEKQPYRFLLKNNEPFSFAGLWDKWQHGDDIISTCTIITTKPNSLVKNVHDRMPVILQKEYEKVWLDRTITDPTQLKPLLTPYDETKMTSYQVANHVNSPKNNHIQCIQAI